MQSCHAYAQIGNMYSFGNNFGKGYNLFDGCEINGFAPVRISSHFVTSTPS